MPDAKTLVIALLLILAGAEAGVIGARLFGSSDAPIGLESVGPLHSITVDASRRSILVAANGHFCSEPVPDAINAFAKELAAKAAGKAESGKETGADIDVALSQIEKSDVNKLFERSQGIQALRDGMYRLCEAFLNNAISSETFDEQMSDLTATLNFIVPIELCSKLESDIVSSLSKSELLQLSTDNERKAGKDAAQAVPAEPLRPGGAAPASGSNVIANSEVLSSRFISGCIELGSQFARTLKQSSDVRTAARLASDRLAVSASDAQAAAAPAAASPAAPGSAAPPTTAAPVNPYTDTTTSKP